MQQGLAKEGIKQERRPLLLVPEQFKYQWLDETSVRIEFYLPAGCYATSVIRELVENMNMMLLISNDDGVRAPGLLSTAATSESNN